MVVLACCQQTSLVTSPFSCCFYRCIQVDLFAKGFRFYHENMVGFDRQVVDHIIINGLGVKDKAFRLELRPAVKKIAIQTRDTLVNNKKSPFRDYLKRCE